MSAELAYLRYKVVVVKDPEGVYIPSVSAHSYEQKIEKEDHSLLHYGGLAAFPDSDLLLVYHTWFEGNLDLKEVDVKFGKPTWTYVPFKGTEVYYPMHAKVYCRGKIYTRIPYSDLRIIMKFKARVKLHLLLKCGSVAMPDDNAAKRDLERNLYGIIPRLLAKYMGSTLRRRFRVIFHNWFRKVGREFREMVYPVLISLWGDAGKDDVRIPASITVYRCKCGVICYGVYEALAHYFKDHRGKSKEELLKQMEMNLQVMKGVLKYYLEKGYSKKDLVNLYRGIHALEKYLLKARASQ